MTKKLGRSWLLTICCTLTIIPLAAQVPTEASHPGDALRARLHLTLPASDTMVVVYGIAQHHTRTEWSVVALRATNGEWTVERAGEEGPGLLPIAPHPLPTSKIMLGKVQGQQLDRLLHERDVFNEKVSGGDLSVGGYASAMEIVTKRRVRRIDWTGRLSGKLGQIADIVIGPG